MDERDRALESLKELQQTLEDEREFWETELSEKLQEIEKLQKKAEAANSQLASFAMQVWIVLSRDRERAQSQ